MIGILIDTFTLFYRRFVPRKKEYRDTKDLTVTAICPVYNEEDTLEDGVLGLINQTVPLRSIFILDDVSTDGTEQIGRALQARFPGRVIYLRMPENSGKAKNINNLIEDRYFDLGDLIFINDGDCIPLPDCIEVLLHRFSDPRVVAVTGFPLISEAGPLINRLFTKGKNWQINSLIFRKAAQAERDCMSVLCGAICLYDKKTVKQIPAPIRTATEDLDHTWILVEAGHRLEFERNSYTISPDVANLKSQWAQSYRWSKGFWQTFYFHMLERSLDKAPMQKYTVVYIALIDLALMLFRYILMVMYAYTGSFLILLYLVGEVIVYLIPGITFYGWRGIAYLPFNFLYQLLTFLTFTKSWVEMTWDYLHGRVTGWNNRWSREYGKRSVPLDGMLGMS